MIKWRVKTGCLKYFDVGDIVVRLYEKSLKKVILVRDTEEICDYLDGNLIDLKPEWFHKVEDIYVWGMNTDSNISRLFVSKPHLDMQGNYFGGADCADGRLEIEFVNNCDFPEDKPQKYKLVPVNNDD